MPPPLEYSANMDDCENLSLCYTSVDIYQVDYTSLATIGNYSTGGSERVKT